MASEFLLAGVGRPGVWVKLHNNSTLVDYFSTTQTDSHGLYIHNAPGGRYTVYASTSLSLPPTGDQSWAPTGASDFLVPYVAGDAIVGSSFTAVAGTGPYGAFLPGAPTIPTPAGVTTGAVWDYGGFSYNVKAFGAKGDGVTDDTVAIQAALNLTGVIDVGVGAFVFSTLTYKGNTMIRGAGGGAAGVGPTTQFYQKNGAASPFLTALNGVAGTSGGLIIQDVCFSAFNNQASNAGGLWFTATVGLQCIRVQVTYCKVFGFRCQGGTTGGDAQQPTFMSCVDQNLQAGSFGYHFQTNAASGSSADGANLIDCWSNATDTWVRIDNNGSPRGYGAEVQMIANRLLSLNSSSVINADGYIKATCNRFEVTGAAQTLTVSIGNSTFLTFSSGFFSGNTYAAPGGVTWTDNGPANGGQRAERLGEIFPASVHVNQFNRDVNIGTASDGITSVTMTGQRITKTNAIASAMQFQEGSGSGYQFLNAAGNANALTIGNSGLVTALAAQASGKAAPTYSASITPNCTAGNWQTITVTNGTAFTINAPSSPPSGAVTQELTIEIVNSSGGAMGVITWNGAFILVGGAFTNPASTKKRYIRFEWNGLNWIEISRASADY